MTDSADDKNNITTMKALVFHGPDKPVLEGRPGPNPRHDARYSAFSQNEIPAAECLKDSWSASCHLGKITSCRQCVRESAC